MSRIFWDTMLFVYLLEDNERYGERVANILSRMQERGDELCTSALAVGEVLVGPYKQGANEAATKIREFFASPFVQVLPFDADTAVHYANIRSRFRVPPADAMHLACAAEGKTDLFLTNDATLIGKAIPGIQFITGMNTDLL
ncbi:MAG: PIN domain-containing protein [Terriglobales bacterium]